MILYVPDNIPRYSKYMSLIPIRNDVSKYVTLQYVDVRCSFVWDTCHILWHGSPSGLRLLLELPHIWLGLSDKVLKIRAVCQHVSIKLEGLEFGPFPIFVGQTMVLPGESAVSRSTRSVKWARTELGLSYPCSCWFELLVLSGTCGTQKSFGL